MKTPYGLWGFLSGHAPHMGRPASERKAWWQRFEQHAKRLRCCKHVFWLGDFNAQIAEHDEPTVGDLADDHHNENGDCLYEVLKGNQMWLPSTYRDYHWGPIKTWFSAKCPTGKRLDYVAVSMDIPILKVASWVEGSLDAGQIHLDHMAAFLRVDFVLPTTREKFSKKLTIDRSAVCDPRNREVITRLLDSVEQPPWQCDVHTHYDELSSQIFEAISSTFPSTRTRPRRTYITETSWFLWKQKQDARRALHELNLHHQRIFLRTFFRAWRQPNWSAVLMFEMKMPNRKLACAVHQLGKMNQALKSQLGSDKKEHFDRLAVEADSAEPAFVWEKLKRLGIGRVFRRTGRNVLPMLEGLNGQPVTNVQEAQQIWRSHAEMLEFGATVSRKKHGTHASSNK